MSEAVTDASENGSSGEHAHQHSITITVNKKSVPITGPRVNGLQIKQAAIAADVQIELDFQLAKNRDGVQNIVGDDDQITVNKHSVFVCTAGDDNSSAERQS